MPVAKSFQSLEIVEDIYTVSGRQYVKVRTKTGAIRQVRWYSDREYARLYPNEIVIKKDDPYYRPQKEVLGFDKGYITIFKGDTYPHKDYFIHSEARYTRWWGWYFASTLELPADLPEDIEPLKLSWDLVGKDDEKLKPENEVLAAVESVLYGADSSEYQGNIGDKITTTITIEKNIPLEGYYGISYMHIMRDDANNCFVWITTARNWEVGSRHTITGTIKELKQYKGIKQTILTRCRETKQKGK